MKKSLVLIASGALSISLAGCDVEKTQEGEMPKVEVTGGQIPKYDVDAPEVDVKTEKRTVEVPVVDVEEADAGKKD